MLFQLKCLWNNVQWFRKFDNDIFNECFANIAMCIDGAMFISNERRAAFLSHFLSIDTVDNMNFERIESLINGCSNILHRMIFHVTDSENGRYFLFSFPFNQFHRLVSHTLIRFIFYTYFPSFYPILVCLFCSCLVCFSAIVRLNMAKMV